MNLRVVVAVRLQAVRLLLVCVALASAVAHGANAQSPSRSSGPATAVGVWRGTSLCLVRPSPCNDETVVYRISQLKSADSVALDGRKVVHGEEEQMGVLFCRFVPSDGQLTCVLPQSVWHFTVRGDSLTGELRMRDNTRFRDVRTVRAP